MAWAEEEGKNIVNELKNKAKYDAFRPCLRASSDTFVLFKN